MRSITLALLSCSALGASQAWAAEAETQADDSPASIVVTGERYATASGTKSDVPLIEVPQAITAIEDDVFLAQGALSVGDTLRYVAGVQANPYGPDSRVDGATVRGVDALQFRDGMRDIYSYYASIRSDPYNFSRVELIRGPSSALFGSGAIGGLMNLVSKTPQFEQEGEIAIRYGSFDRKEALADFTGPLSDNIAARIVARMRDSGSQTDHVPDDRVMISPSITFRLGDSTALTLLGLYQEDDSGSTSQFLPIVGSIVDNPNGKLPRDLFVGKPGWDRYDGRLLQGSGILEHRFNDSVKLSLKARYIDSDLTYFTHYTDSYSNPTNPYLDPAQRLIGLYSDGSYAHLNVFSTDNNVQFKFNTGAHVEHILLAGIDYSWNKVRKTGGFGYQVIDLYDIDYDALSDYDGGLPPDFGISQERTTQKQLGFYLQDQIRLMDKVSVVLGARRDRVSTQGIGSPRETVNATTLRGGIIVEIVPGVSPYFSYTESFDPISGTASDGNPFKPQRGKQLELGIKFQPDQHTLISLTAYKIKETNRPIDDPSTPDPTDQMQAGELTSKGIELEASRRLPGDIDLFVNFSYNKAELTKTDDPARLGVQIDDVPKYNASAWIAKTFALGEDTSLVLGGGVRYDGARKSRSAIWTISTPDVTLVDALASIQHGPWNFSVNATNLLGKKYYSNCLSRGDCFNGSDRNVFGTLAYKF